MVTDFFRTLKPMVRTTLPPANLMPTIRDAVYAASPSPPVYSVSTMDELVSESMVSRKLPVVILGRFAALALLHSSVGIYGVVSYSVMRRTRRSGSAWLLALTEDNQRPHAEKRVHIFGEIDRECVITPGGTGDLHSTAGKLESGNLADGLFAAWPLLPLPLDRSLLLAGCKWIQ
jgi:hypothetical protein